MASFGDISRMSAARYNYPTSLTEPNDEHLAATKPAGDEILCGTQLSPKRTFRGKNMTVHALPIIVDFRRLLSLASKHAVDVVAGIPNRELLHAVIALYNTSLSEMTPEVLYATVCEKLSRSVILLRDVKECIQELEQKRLKTTDQFSTLSQAGLPPTADDAPDKHTPEVAGESKDRRTVVQDQPPTDNNEAGTPETAESNGEKEDVFEPVDEPRSIFCDVFSEDDEDEDEEEEQEDVEDRDEEEEEDFSQGVHHFIEAAAARRLTQMSHVGPFTSQHVGIENRLVAVATLKKTYCKHDKLTHLTVLAVRKKYRNAGIGQYLIAQVKDTAVSGLYDAIVVHADHSAVPFFKKYGFSDDLILNSKWASIAEQFTNCSLMSYLPPYTGHCIADENAPKVDILTMQRDINKWRQKSLEAYQAETVCMTRLQAEIVHLRMIVDTQQQHIDSMMVKNEILSSDKFFAEKQLMDYKISVARTARSNPPSDDDDNDTEQLLQSLENAANLAHGMSSVTAADTFLLCRGAPPAKNVYDHSRDTQDFYRVSQVFLEAMKNDRCSVGSYEVKSVAKAMLPDDVEDAHKLKLASLKHPDMVTRLYYCGGADRPQRMLNILKTGFYTADFTAGDYGEGLYFSKYPSRAAEFSVLGKLIVAEVGLGNIESVITKDRKRKTPQDDYDSMVTPGRLTANDDNIVTSQSQEFVLFSAVQAVPLFLLEYTSKTE